MINIAEIVFVLCIKRKLLFSADTDIKERTNG